MRWSDDDGVAGVERKKCAAAAPEPSSGANELKYAWALACGDARCGVHIVCRGVRSNDEDGVDDDVDGVQGAMWRRARCGVDGTECVGVPKRPRGSHECEAESGEARKRCDKGDGALCGVMGGSGTAPVPDGAPVS